MPDLPVIGAQLSFIDLPKFRDWIMEKDRDVEIPEFIFPEILDNPDEVIGQVRRILDGYQGRLGIHGPFFGFDVDVKEPEIRKIAVKRLVQGITAAEKLGARQMVIHSPYRQWEHCNLDEAPKGRARKIEAIAGCLEEPLRVAVDAGVELVLENIQDMHPRDRREAVEAINSPNLRLSVDTGHAHWTHTMNGAPPADRFISDAGKLLGHVHLQDADGYADRHWALGEGNILWTAIMRAIVETGANPTLIIELNDSKGVMASMAHLESLGIAQ